MNKQQVKQLVRLTREDKALQLFKAGAVSRISDDLFYVKSQNDPGIEYEVIPSMNVCTCVDFERTGRSCKHIIAAQIFRTCQIAAALTAAKIQTPNKVGKVVMITC
jgi:hypothetical protein